MNIFFLILVNGTDMFHKTYRHTHPPVQPDKI